MSKEEVKTVKLNDNQGDLFESAFSELLKIMVETATNTKLDIFTVHFNLTLNLAKFLTEKAYEVSDDHEEIRADIEVFHNSWVKYYEILSEGGKELRNMETEGREAGILNFVENINANKNQIN